MTTPRKRPNARRSRCTASPAWATPCCCSCSRCRRAGDLGWRGRLYLALAFKAAGDDAAARKLMDEIAKQYGEDQAPNKRLRVGTDQGDIVEATSLMAVLAAGLDDSAADAYFRYLQQNAPKDTPNYIEQLQYLKTALQRSGAAGVTFTYSLDGKKTDAELKGGKTVSHVAVAGSACRPAHRRRQRHAERHDAVPDAAPAARADA